DEEPTELTLVEPYTHATARYDIGVHVRGHPIVERPVQVGKRGVHDHASDGQAFGGTAGGRTPGGSSAGPGGGRRGRIRVRQGEEGLIGVAVLRGHPLWFTRGIRQCRRPRRYAQAHRHSWEPLIKLGHERL